MIPIGLKYNWASQIVAVLNSGFGKIAVVGRQNGTARRAGGRGGLYPGDSEGSWLMSSYGCRCGIRSRDMGLVRIIWDSWSKERIFLIFLSRTENYVIIVAGSVPPLRPLFAVLLRRLKSTRTALGPKQDRITRQDSNTIDLTPLAGVHIPPGRSPAFGENTEEPWLDTSSTPSRSEGSIPSGLHAINKTVSIDVDWNGRSASGPTATPFTP